MIFLFNGSKISDKYFHSTMIKEALSRLSGEPKKPAGIEMGIDRRVRELTHEPHLTGAFLAADTVLTRGSAGFENDVDKQKVVDELNSKVNKMLTGRRAFLATPWAAAYRVLTGGSCWSNEDGKRMKEDLGTVVKNCLTNEPDEKAAGYAANYRLLFNKEEWDSRQKAKMIEATKNAMNRYENGLGKNPSLIDAFSSSEAIIRVLNAAEIEPKLGGIKIIDAPTP